MLARTVGVLLLGAAALACGRSPTTREGLPAPSTSVSAPGSVAIAPLGVEAGSSADASSAATPEIYVGAVAGAPVRATLSLSSRGLEGRWVYEKTGSPGGLKLTSLGPPKAGRYPVRESTDAGELAGELELAVTGIALTGSWHKPGKEGSLAVLLTRQERSRRGDTIVQARVITGKPRDSATSAGVGFAPVVVGPVAARLNANLKLKKLLDEDDAHLEEWTTTLDFDVLHHDDRILTIALLEETMAAYPSSHGVTASFDLRTGTRLGREIFVHDRAKLSKKLDAMVRAAWRDKKRELMKRPDAGSDCGAEVAETFMSGDGPSFTIESLDTVFADVRGLHFGFDFGFPHVALACSPTVDLSMSWAEAKTFLDPAGPLAAF
jgi:hypothetical protein